VEPSALNAFLTGLEADEAAALTQLLHQPVPPGGIAAAEDALRILEIARMNALVQRLQSQMKQPGLNAEDVAEISGEIAELRRELQAAQKAIGKGQVNDEG